MSKAFRLVGGAFFVVGIVFLAVLYFTGYSFVNALTLSALALVITGLALHLWGVKRESPY